MSTTAAYPVPPLRSSNNDNNVMPRFLLTNTNRLLNKLDELSILCDSLQPSVIAITETWLNDEITDCCISISTNNGFHYTVYRHDRTERQGGGVLFYVRSDIQSHRLSFIDTGNHEVLWIALRPRVLPRPISILVCCVLYCPPWYSTELKSSLITHIATAADSIRRKHMNAAFIVCGDFNSLDSQFLSRYNNFIQIRSTVTRGNNVLDRIFISRNCSNFYNSVADVLPPLGNSDHRCVLLQPLSRDLLPRVGFNTVFKRNFNNFNINTIAVHLCSVDWRPLFASDDVQFQSDYFYSVVNTILDNVVPVTACRVRKNEKPWVTPYFKKNVALRDRAYRAGDLVLYKKLRNRVNHLRVNLKKDYYFKLAESFNSSNIQKWWKTIKLISGYSSSDNNVYNNLCYNNEPISHSDLPETINSFFLSCSSDVPCLQPNILQQLRNSLPSAVPEQFIVSEYSVYHALCGLKLNKAVGPDGLSNKLLTSLAGQFCTPLCSMINCSIRTGEVPSQWKLSRVTPLPKMFPPLNIESDLRPISITSSCSKIAESFVCRFFNDVFTDHCDDNQFGCIKGRSTTLALIKFFHYLYCSTDNSENFARVLLVDFKKAFDLINHNILYKKMMNINLPPHLTLWFLSFLNNRSQFVSINSSSSSTQYVNAGTPQGTLSGPQDFNLLINDLVFNIEYIKYVDDTTTTSVSDDPLDDALQHAADDLSSFCSSTDMHINVGKTKEMLIYFGKRYPSQSIPTVHVNGTSIERVNSTKLLGVYFNNRLDWKDHVTYIVTKASKRIFCLSQLVRAGISTKQLVNIYCSLIRSVLEYCCQVWHPGLSVQETRDIENIQKRCLKIIFPNTDYATCLQLSGLQRLSERREILVRDLFNEIKCDNHVLNSLLPRRSISAPTRNSYPYVLPVFKTNRTRRDFISYCLFKRY